MISEFFTRPKHDFTRQGRVDGWLGRTLHWGRVTHICVGKLTIIGPDNGLSPGRRQAIIWTNAGILLIGPLGTNFSEILIAIETFSFKKKHLKMSSGKCRPFCLGLNVLNKVWLCTWACSDCCHSNGARHPCHSICSEHRGHLHATEMWANEEFIKENHIDGLVQERRNSIANALEIRLSCTNPSISSNANVSCQLTSTWFNDYTFPIVNLLWPIDTHEDRYLS